MSAARRELAAAVAGAAVAGGLALSAGGQAWATVTVDRRAPLPPVTGLLTGGDAAPLGTAAGLVLLAGAVALLAVRGAGRVLVGLLLAVAGGVLVWSGVRALAGGLEDAAASLDLGGLAAQGTRVETSAVWPSLALVAGALGILAGVLVAVRGRGWPAMGRRYERAPAASPRPASQARDAGGGGTDEERAAEAWKALDRGEDPTA